ncbi:hypothetical protein CIN01S_07_02590 [Chryseobacterium indologenes NBRC 14944]|nr:hypothetical protein CIN01S_07_02590 [Chryseobacterium indologenes NBRC 14944]
MVLKLPPTYVVIIQLKMYFQYTRIPTIMEAVVISTTPAAAISLIKPILLSKSGCMKSQIFSMDVLKISALKTAKETKRIRAASIPESCK